MLRGLPAKRLTLFSAIREIAKAQRDVKGTQAIVNFNYDDLIDEWLRDQGVRCDTIKSGKQRARASSLPCYHVHGVLPFGKFKRLRELRTRSAGTKKIIGNFVFSEDDYHTEYSDPYRWSNMTMLSLLGRYTGLWVGVSLEDPNHRRLLDVTHRQYPDVKQYAILTRSKPLPAANTKGFILPSLFESVESESFKSIGVRVIWTDSYKEVPDRVREICRLD